MRTQRADSIEQLHQRAAEIAHDALATTPLEVRLERVERSEGTRWRAICPVCGPLDCRRPREAPRRQLTEAQKRAIRQARQKLARADHTVARRGDALDAAARHAVVAHHGQQWSVIGSAA